MLTEVGGIGGSVNITGASGLVVIGAPGHGNCAANVISGALVLKDNTDGVVAINNRVGSLVAANNSGSGPYSGDNTTISGNHQ